MINKPEIGQNLIPLPYFFFTLNLLVLCQDLVQVKMGRNFSF